MKVVPPPNYTQLPNYILDHLDEFSSEAELKVVLAIARKTFGWHKKSDRISLTQLVTLTGMTRQSVVNGLDAALADGWIERKSEGQSFTYSVVVQNLDQSDHDASLKDVPELVQNLDTQKKGLNKKNSGGQKPPPWGMEVDRLMGVFSKVCGTQLPLLKSQADFKAAQIKWIKPLQEIVRNCNGNSEAIISEAVKQMRRDGLTFAFPSQILTVALSINAGKVAPVGGTQFIEYTP